MTARVAAALLGIVAAAVAGLAVMIGREPGGIRLAAPSVTASAAPGPASRPPELVTLPPDAAPPPPPPRTATARNEDRPAPPPPRESPHPKPEVRAEIRRIQADLDRARPDEKPPLIEKLGGIVDLIVAEILKFYVMGFEVQGVPALTQQVRLAAAKALGKMRDPNNPAVAARAAAILMEACDERFNKKEKEGDAVVRMCIESLGNLQERGAFKFLKSMLSHTNNYWAADAIGAFEKYEEPAMVLQVVAPIVSEWQRAEEGARGRWADDRAKERRTVLGESAGRTLALLTGQNFDTPQKWNQWWDDARRQGWTPPRPAEEGK